MDTNVFKVINNTNNEANNIYLIINTSNEPFDMEYDSYIFEIPSTSNEKPSILIEIPSISIEITQKFWNTRFFTPLIRPKYLVFRKLGISTK